MKESHKALLVPGSILIAAVVIGVAIIVAFGGQSSNSQTTAAKDTRPTIQEAARKVSLDRNAIDACVANKETAARVDRDMQNGNDMQIAGTPFTVVVGPDGRTIGIPGAQPREAWDQIIDYILSGEEIPEDEADLSSLVLPVDASDHILGNPDATVTLIEYSDIDCPFCQRLHDTLHAVVTERDDVRWVFRHFPIASLHPAAYNKALATECVYELSGNDNETFWNYLDLLIGSNVK